MVPADGGDANLRFRLTAKMAPGGDADDHFYRHLSGHFGGRRCSCRRSNAQHRLLMGQPCFHLPAPLKRCQRSLHLQQQHGVAIDTRLGARVYNGWPDSTALPKGPQENHRPSI